MDKKINCQKLNKNQITYNKTTNFFQILFYISLCQNNSQSENQFDKLQHMSDSPTTKG